MILRRWDFIILCVSSFLWCVYGVAGNINLNIFFSIFCLCTDLNYWGVVLVVIMFGVYDLRWRFVLLYILILTGFFMDDFFLLIPKSLMNGLFNIHPVGVCIIYFFFFWQIFARSRIFFCFWEYRVVNMSVVKFNGYVVSGLLVTIVLGGWWANQELGWGGWWSWDNVEVVLLFWLLGYVVLMHSFLVPNVSLFHWFSVVFSVIVLHLLVRNDLTNSIHSFLGGRVYVEIYWAILFIYACLFIGLLRENYNFIVVCLLSGIFYCLIFMIFGGLLSGVFGMNFFEFNTLWVFFLGVLNGLLILIFNNWWLWWLCVLGGINMIIIAVCFLFNSYRIFLLHTCVLILFMVNLLGVNYDMSSWMFFSDVWFDVGGVFVDLFIGRDVGVGVFNILSQITDIGVGSFFDANGIYNFSGKSMYCGGLYVLENVVSLWQWGMELWIYVICFIVYVIGRNFKFFSKQLKIVIRYLWLKLKSQSSQKNRRKPVFKFSIDTPTTYDIRTYGGGRFEYIYFFHIKKIFKRFCINKKSYFTRRGVKFFVTSNFPLSKKAKNARMGSGKGYFLRWAIRFKKNSTVVRVQGIPLVVLRRIVRWWNISLGLKLYVG